MPNGLRFVLDIPLRMVLLYAGHELILRMPFDRLAPSMGLRIDWDAIRDRGCGSAGA